MIATSVGTTVAIARYCLVVTQGRARCPTPLDAPIKASYVVACRQAEQANAANTRTARSFCTHASHTQSRHTASPPTRARLIAPRTSVASSPTTAIYNVPQDPAHVLRRRWPLCSSDHRRLRPAAVPAGSVRAPGHLNARCRWTTQCTPQFTRTRAPSPPLSAAARHERTAQRDEVTSTAHEPRRAGRLAPIVRRHPPPHPPLGRRRPPPLAHAAYPRARAPAVPEGAAAEPLMS